MDEETGLYYNRYRYYDPRQGRYITQDPIGLAGGMNSYAYVSNPTSSVDPLGLESGPSDPYSQLIESARTAQSYNPPRPAVTACPSSPPPNTGNTTWTKYWGDSRVFHCGYRTFHERITPSSAQLQSECVYDELDQLVDANHTFAGCGGTPNRWGKDNPILHTIWDEGGIAHIGRLESAGVPALVDSIRHGSAVDWFKEILKGDPDAPVPEMPLMP